MIGPLQTEAITTPDAALDGRVEIADGVALADGVVLDAVPGCRLIISSGSCLGRGVIIQAHRGDLVIEPGVVLGSGVLVVGTGRIGQNACIGADSTLIDPKVQANQVVPPKSLLGDPSQPQTTTNSLSQDLAMPEFLVMPESLASNDQPSPEIILSPVSPVMDGARSYSDQSSEVTPIVMAVLSVGSADQGSTAAEQSPSPSAPSPRHLSSTDSSSLGSTLSNGSNGSNGSSVHGQKQVNQLLETLFPHRRSLNGASPQDKP